MVGCLGQEVPHKRLRASGHTPQRLGLSTRLILLTLPLSKQQLKPVAQAYTSAVSRSQVFQPCWKLAETDWLTNDLRLF